jgi:hypothetical protein
MNDAKSSKATKLLLVALVAGVWGLLLSRWLAPDARAVEQAAAPAREITVQRINIVDADGRIRMVLAGQDRFPDPVVRGKSVPRSIRDTAGVVFYDAEGNEAGGLAIARSGNDTGMGALILDYGYQPTDGIGLVKTESADGEHFTAGLTIADRRPYKPGPIESSEGVSRIWLSNRDRNASLEIADTDGKPRIRIGVDAQDRPSFEILDGNGKVVKNLASTD